MELERELRGVIREIRQHILEVKVLLGNCKARIDNRLLDADIKLNYLIEQLSNNFFKPTAEGLAEELDTEGDFQKD